MAAIRPTHENFQGENYDNRWQISNARVERQDPTKRRVIQRTSGTAMQVTGRGLNTAGKTVDRGGTVAMRGGIALSATGVGAVVGVPLAVAGAAGKVVGKSTSAAGKTINKTGEITKNRARVADVQDKARSSIGIKTLKTTGKLATNTAKRVALGIVWAWSGPTYLFILLPLAILTNIAIGMVVAINYAAANLGVSYETAQSSGEIVGVLPEFDFMLLLGVCYLLLVTFHYLFMTAIYLHCKVLFSKPLKGGFKKASFILSAILIWMPIVNILPLYWIWLGTITVNPK